MKRKHSRPKVTLDMETRSTHPLHASYGDAEIWSIDEFGVIEKTALDRINAGDNPQLRAYAYGAHFADQHFSDVTMHAFERYNSADLGTEIHRRIMHIDGGDLIHGEVHRDYTEIENRTVKWLADRMEKMVRDAIYGGSYGVTNNMEVNQSPTSYSEPLDKALAPAKSDPKNSTSAIAIAKATGNV